MVKFLFRLSRRLLLAALLVVVLAAAGCAPQAAAAENKMENGLLMAGHGMLPDDFERVPDTVRDAYRFAIANPEVLEALPCYCGCGAAGHTSNYACYIRDDSDPDNLVFDNHALGCTICVDITVDAMRMSREGKSLPEIRAFVDQTYSAYGPSNIP